MLYIVTGANGHLGSTIVKYLIEDKKKVRGLVLKGSDISMLKSLNVEIIYGDVRNIESLIALFDYEPQEKVCLIHTAGIISITENNKSAMYDVNVIGTNNVLKLAKKYGITHFIYISSVHAILEPKEDSIITEPKGMYPKEVMGTYAQTKAEATKNVFEHQKLGFSTTIVYPSGIIGPYDSGNGYMTKMIIKYMNRHLNARIKGKYNFVDVRDIAKAILSIAENQIEGQFILSGHSIELKDLFLIMKTIAGKKKKAVVVSTWFLKVVMPLVTLYYKMRKQTPLFTKYSLYTLRTHCNFSHERATHFFNYRPRKIEETILDTTKWLISKDIIKDKKTVSHVQSHFKTTLN